MRRRTMVAGLALVMSATACNSFLSEPDAIRDPNNPSTQPGTRACETSAT